jgi:hypothetical protein
MFLPPETGALLSEESSMRRTRVVPVTKPSSEVVSYMVTERKAESLVENGRAIRKDNGTLELIAESAGTNAASIEAVALRRAFADEGAQIFESIGKTTQFILSRSPYRFAQRDRVSSRRRQR